MLLVASFEVSRFIGLLTRFLHEIFAFFVCSIYIVDGVQGMTGRFIAGTLARTLSNTHKTQRYKKYATAEVSLRKSSGKKHFQPAIWMHPRLPLHKHTYAHTHPHNT